MPKLGLSQFLQQKSPKQEDTQLNKLRNSLIERAKKIKQQMYLETNYFDYSIENVMNQTLKQINKHKKQFEQKHSYLPENQQSQESKIKKSQLKSQFIQNLQKCKNKYRKHINSIKDKKKRIYTENNKNDSGDKINVEEMLTTAKDRFKTQQREKRNQSQIIKLKHKNQTQNDTAHKFNSQTQKYIRGTKNHKLYENLIKVNEDLAEKLEEYPRLTEEQISQMTQYKLRDAYVFGIASPLSSKKEMLSAIRTTKKVYYSPYHRFPTQEREISKNQVEIVSSDRSAFVPLGKMVSCAKRQSLQINNQKTQVSIEKVQNKHNYRLSTEITHSLEEIEQNDQKNIINAQSQHSKHLMINSPPRAKLIYKTSQKRKQNILSKSSQLHHQNMIELKSEKQNKQFKMLEDLKGKRIATEHIPIISPFKDSQKSDNNEINRIKIGDQIKGRFNLGKTRDIYQEHKDSRGIRATFYNKKFNDLGRMTLKGKFKDPPQNSDQKDHALHVVRNYKKQLSRSINLDIRGNHLKLANSIKIQRSNNYISLELSQPSNY